MSLASLIAKIDAELARFQQVRALLSGGAAPAGEKRGRPAGVVKAAGKYAKKKAKHKISPEGRARIAAAVKARWAKQKKAAK
jgi:hypothetical protein